MLISASSSISAPARSTAMSPSSSPRYTLPSATNGEPQTAAKVS